MKSLKSINTNHNDVMYHENLKYLNDLKKSVKHINAKTSNISINNIILDEINKYMYLDFQLKDFDDSICVSFVNYLSLTKDNIKKLKNDIPNYVDISITEKRNISIEYSIFHDNIINKITTFILYYSDYFNKLYEMYKSLIPIIKKTTNELNVISSNYDTLIINGVINMENIELLNKAMLIKKELNKITSYNNYLAEQINYYTSIKKEFKLINVDFLNNLNKES